MITLSAKINLLANNAGNITGASDLSSLASNISANLSSVLEKRYTVRNPFIIGVNKLGDGSTFSKGEQYFISKERTDENGYFLNPIEFYIYGNDISMFNIKFDDKNNVFPTSIIVDGTDYENNDATFTVSADESNTHLIQITKLNAPNKNLIITGIFVNIEINIKARNIVKMSRSIFDRSDLNYPSWGIISNSADFEFIDFYDEIREYIEQKVLGYGSEVDMYLNNTLSATKEMIGTFYSGDWNYDNDNKTVKTFLKDDLEEWQEIKVAKYDLRKNKTMLEIYQYLVSITPKKWQFEIEQGTIDFLQNIICEYAYLNQGTLWYQWQKFCEICMLHIYKNNKGNVFVKHFI